MDAETTRSSSADWRTLSLSEREREYSPSSCVGGDIGPLIAEYVQGSENARNELQAAGVPIHEIAYGSEPSQTIDLAVPRADEPVPLLVFIHGGYWRQLSKRESFFSAAQCTHQGVAFAAVDYTLAPEASLDDIVAECRRAVDALRHQASGLGIDPERIIVAGSSAGAQLAAMVGLGTSDDWRPAALVLLSGVFDLEPLIGTYINEPLQLDVQSARRNSPIFDVEANFPRTLVAFGSNETSEFKRQSTAMTNALKEADVPAMVVEIHDRNHFNVVLDLCDPDASLGWLVMDLTA